MNLHSDGALFLELVQVAAQRLQVPEAYIEKDYWVTRALKHLSESPDAGVVVFKGGTALSKAYKLINRFSEDIDLAICFNGHTGPDKSHDKKRGASNRFRADSGRRRSKGKQAWSV